MENDSLDHKFYCNSKFCQKPQDVEIRRSGPHVGAWCRSCGKWVTWLPKDHRMARQLPRTEQEALQIKQFPQEASRNERSEEDCPF